MKKTLCILGILVIGIVYVSAQSTETIKITGAEYPEFLAKKQYKYPAYTRAKIAFKNGDMASARINYNNFLHIMKYIDEKGDTLEIANPDDINYLAVGVDTIFYDKVYYDWVASSATARLVIRHTYKESVRELIGAFGTTSPAKNIESHTKILNDGVSSNDLSRDEEVTISKETTYYISPINGTKNNFVVATKNNINKLFPKKNVEKFVKENKLNLNKEEDLIDLMVYISKPK
jgi:hypothetical protein